jgi:hypothetical protein
MAYCTNIRPPSLAEIIDVLGCAEGRAYRLDSTETIGMNQEVDIDRD